MKKITWYTVWNTNYLTVADFSDYTLAKAEKIRRSLERGNPERKVTVIKVTYEEVMEDQ